MINGIAGHGIKSWAIKRLDVEWDTLWFQMRVMAGKKLWVEIGIFSSCFVICTRGPVTAWPILIDVSVEAKLEN